MPEWVDSCVSSMLGKWERDPSARPKPKEAGQKAKDQAWAICTAAHKKQKAEFAHALTIMLEGGQGPTVIGAAATNRPYIPQLEETVVVEEDEKKHLVVHLANPGFYNHPLGPFSLNRAVFLAMIDNFDKGILGQKAAYDCRHRPNDGAYGWFVGLSIDEKSRLFGEVDPTPVGLKAIENREFLYSSLEFHRNFHRDDAKLDLERAEVFTSECMDLEEFTESESDSEEEDAEKGTEVDDMGENTEKLEKLEGQVTTLEKEKQDALDLATEGEKRAKEAEEKALSLERDALDASIDAVVSLAKNHRDEDGNGHSRVLIKWIDKVLRFGDLGEDDDVVRLSDDEKPTSEVVKYLLAATKELVEGLPGVVPAEQETSGDAEDKEKGKDDCDYEGEWEES